MRLKRLIQKKTKKFIIKKLSNNFSTLFQAYNLSKKKYCEIPYVKLKFKKSSNLAKKNETIYLKIDGQILPKILATGDYDTFLYNFLKTKKLKNICFIDIGANHGFISKQISNLPYIKKIITFEPFTPIFKLLELNLKKINNIHNFNFGLSKKNQNLSFYENPSNSGDLSLINNKQRTLKHICKFKNYNQIMKNIMNGTKNMNFIIKTDCQGYDVELFNDLNVNFFKKTKIYFLECNKIQDNQKDIFLKKINFFKRIFISCPLIHKNIKKIGSKDLQTYLDYKVEFDLILVN